MIPGVEQEFLAEEIIAGKDIQYINAFRTIDVPASAVIKALLKAYTGSWFTLAVAAQKIQNERTR